MAGPWSADIPSASGRRPRSHLAPGNPSLNLFALRAQADRMSAILIGQICEINSVFI